MPKTLRAAAIFAGNRRRLRCRRGEGLKRPQAQQIAAQAVLGSAKLVLESGKHPGQLKDEVCSPFGSTIRGVVVLEKGAFRGTVIDALRTTIARARSP